MTGEGKPLTALQVLEQAHIRPEDYGALELWVFGNHEHARFAGFSGASGQHRDIQHAVAWWLGRPPNDIRGYRLSRVVICESVRIRIMREPWLQQDFDYLRETARLMLRFPPMAWVEL